MCVPTGKRSWMIAKRLRQDGKVADEALESAPDLDTPEFKIMLEKVSFHAWLQFPDLKDVVGEKDFGEFKAIFATMQSYLGRRPKRRLFRDSVKGIDHICD